MRVTAKGNAAQIAAQRSLIDALIAHGFSRASIAIRWVFAFYRYKMSGQITMEASYNFGRGYKFTIEWIAESERTWWRYGIYRNGCCPAEGTLEVLEFCNSATAAVEVLVGYIQRAS